MFNKVKWKALISISILLILISDVECKCDYKPCGTEEHTMCKYPATLDKSKKDCSGKESVAGLNQALRHAILDKHNELRQKVALGKADGQPPAADMMQLRWNKEAEEIAQHWVNSCPGVAHDSCRNMKDGTYVGQNAGNGYFKYKEHPNKTADVPSPVTAWYDEIKDMNPAWVDDFSKAGGGVGHYTQLVWAKTDRLGCGYVENNYYDQTFQYFVLICNYVEGGNLANAGTKVYTKGEACSKCPKGTHCSKRFHGLCTAEEDEFNDVPVEKEEKGKGKGKKGEKGASSRFGGASWVVLPVVVTWFQHAV